MTTIVLTVLAGAAIIWLALEIRHLRKRLGAEQTRADAAADDAQRSKAKESLADEHRERAVLGYGEVLAEVQEIAAHLRINREPFVAGRLQRLVDERLDALRRLG